jgi:hypothetical protein
MPVRKPFGEIGIGDARNAVAHHGANLTAFDAHQTLRRIAAAILDNHQVRRAPGARLPRKGRRKNAGSLRRDQFQQLLVD